VHSCGIGEITHRDTIGDITSGRLDDCTGNAAISDSAEMRLSNASTHPVLAEDLLQQWISQDLLLEQSKGEGVSAGTLSN
jgi:hypothetical protein